MIFCGGMWKILKWRQFDHWFIRLTQATLPWLKCDWTKMFMTKFSMKLHPTQNLKNMKESLVGSEQRGQGARRMGGSSFTKTSRQVGASYTWWMNCSVTLTGNKDYLTYSDTRSILLITMLGSVLSATIIIPLYCQSFYNSQHTPSLNFVGKISPSSPWLKCPHPSNYQHAYKRKLGEPTCWSVTDGGLAIAGPLMQRDFKSLFTAPPPSRPPPLSKSSTEYGLKVHPNWN